MQMSMQNGEKLTPQQISEFLKGSEEISFAVASKAEVYSWVQEVLVAQEYASQDKKDRGAIRAYIEKVTGLSVPQATRLIRQYRETGVVALQPSQRLRFPRKYTDRDITLLAETDRAHEWLSGPATRCILRREYEQFSKQQFARLATISTAHLYNLRRSLRYRKASAKFEPTRPTPVSIGERRRPDPQNRPGYLRVDTVHQGDLDGVKGVYHVNAVDTVTQWQVVGCVSRISEQYLLPVLEAMLHQFPFRILGFHSDNGSEFINHSVEKLLNSLFIEFSKSRACRSQDNALGEGKNGAVIRKLIGYGHIAGRHAEAVQKFHTAHLNPYLNFHRPSGFATVSVDARGKRRSTYGAEDYSTPYEKLKSLSDAAKYLKPEMSFASLDLLAKTMSDTEAARKRGRAKAVLLHLCKSESPTPPKCF
jgi:transposase InsO family protein